MVECTRILLDCLRYLVRDKRTVSRAMLGLAVGRIHKHTSIGVPPVARAGSSGLHRLLHGRHHIRLTFRNVEC